MIVPLSEVKGQMEDTTLSVHRNARDAKPGN